MIKVLFSHRTRIQELFEAWCIKNSAAESQNNMIAFLEHRGWLNVEKVMKDMRKDGKE